MLLALLVLALVALALALPFVLETLGRWRESRGRKRESAPRGADLSDPGRERRAERRARELLRSCVNDEEWAMYRDLGFIRVWGRPLPEGGQARRYAYIIYPHKPIVAFVPATGELLSEYCVEFPDLSGAGARSRLPDSDDVLAKWMALTGDERRLISDANMHLPGRQIDPGRVRRDIWRLAEWQRRGARPNQATGSR